MKYTIYQIPKNAEFSDKVNACGSWDEAAERYPDVKAHLECSFHGSSRFATRYLIHFEKVATVEAADLEDVFMKGNFRGEYAGDIENHAPWCSLSVGDIVVDSAGDYYMVDRIGFSLLPV